MRRHEDANADVAGILDSKVPNTGGSCSRAIERLNAYIVYEWTQSVAHLC